jgi:hypothetical protein
MGRGAPCLRLVSWGGEHLVFVAALAFSGPFASRQILRHEGALHVKGREVGVTRDVMLLTLRPDQQGLHCGGRRTTREP